MNCGDREIFHASQWLRSGGALWCPVTWMRYVIVLI
jgi:hypothetical protein